MDDVVGPEDAVPGLVDVSRLALGALLTSDDSVLANSLRRVLAELDRPQEIIAAFDSYP